MRKTVTYLNSLRLELADARQELADIATDLEARTFDLTSLHISAISQPSNTEMADLAKELKKLHLAYGKQLKIVQERIENYRKFF